MTAQHSERSVEWFEELNSVGMIQDFLKNARYLTVTVKNPNTGVERRLY